MLNRYFAVMSKFLFINFTNIFVENLTDLVGIIINIVLKKKVNGGL